MVQCYQMSRTEGIVMHSHNLKMDGNFKKSLISQSCIEINLFTVYNYKNVDKNHFLHDLPANTLVFVSCSLLGVSDVIKYCRETII